MMMHLFIYTSRSHWKISQRCYLELVIHETQPTCRCKSISSYVCQTYVCYSVAKALILSYGSNSYTVALLASHLKFSRTQHVHCSPRHKHRCASLHYAINYGRHDNHITHFSCKFDIACRTGSRNWQVIQKLHFSRVELNWIAGFQCHAIQNRSK